MQTDVASAGYRASQHYVWRNTDTLGHGTFGEVFKGLHKETGEAVAIKTFEKFYLRTQHQALHLQQQEREFSILQKLNHENVVKLLAVEDELSSTRRDARSRKVLIMELCTGGNLYTIVEQPENYFGLSESEFLHVMRDLKNGLKYLWDHRIIHRDLKPSNIMKSVERSGCIVYKLCDFGGAKVMEGSSDQFTSIVGTEEYLHPVIYNRAMLTTSTACQFSATSDLWSIGVTLYHIVTGHLPFRPFGGRKNKQMMHRIPTEKESGVISGFQDSESGPIHWSRELPEHCRLSSGMRPYIRDLLAHLLETKQEQMWTYDHYFAHVDAILATTIVHVLDVFDARAVTVCISAKDISSGRFVPALQRGICQQIPHATPESVLLYRNPCSESFGLLKTCSGGSDVVNRIESTVGATATDPVLLFAKGASTDVNHSCIRCPNEPVFKDDGNLDHDADMARLATGLGYFALRKVDECALLTKLLQRAITAMRCYLKGQVDAVQRAIKAYEVTARVQESFNSGLKDAARSNGGAGDNMLSTGGLLAKKCESVQEITKLLDTVRRHKDDLTRMIDTVESAVGMFHAEDVTAESRAIINLLDSMMEISSEFKRHRLIHIDSNPHCNEMKWHKVQNLQLRSNWQEVRSLLDGGSTLQLLRRLHPEVLRTSPEILNACKLLQITDAVLSSMEEMIDAFADSMNQTADFVRDMVVQKQSGLKLNDTAVPVIMPNVITQNGCDLVSTQAKQLQPSIPASRNTGSVASSRSRNAAENFAIKNGLLEIAQQAKTLRELIADNVQLSRRVTDHLTTLASATKSPKLHSTSPFVSKNV